VNELRDHIPPQCFDIEKVILSSFTYDNAIFLKYSPVLLPCHFYDTFHSAVYAFMVESRSTDTNVILDKFPDKLGPFLAISGAYSSANLDTLIDILIDRYNRRKMITACIGIIDKAETDFDLTAGKISEDGISSLILDSKSTERPEILADIAPRLFGNLEIVMKGEGIKTGLCDIDNIMGAIQPGEYIILAGRPSMGKTALALCVARNLANQSLSPLIFSVETSKEVLCARLIFGETECSYDKILRGDTMELNRSNATCFDIVSKPIWIDGTPAISLGHIEATAENYVKNHGCNFLIIDHVGLVKNVRGRSRHEELSEISKGIKTLLQKLCIPGIILCQLSREVEKRNPPIPMLSDLRDSGSLEEDSDKVLFIYREEYYKRDSNKKGIAEILIAKNKNGRTGYTEVVFDKATMNFRNLAKRDDDFGQTPQD
jgi:replicative DNA helicase